jgi:hypothetical protein
MKKLLAPCVNPHVYSQALELMNDLVCMTGVAGEGENFCGVAGSARRGERHWRL